MDIFWGAEEEDTAMSDEPTKLSYRWDLPSKSNVTDAELIPKLHGGLREIDLQ